MIDPAISIIVPVYNVEDYIDDCLKSILEQSFQSFEIIVIDDGSTDQTLKKAELYKSKHDRINIISQSNKGVSVARNKGITAAKAPILSFVDGDDVLAPHYLQEFMSSIKDADMVATSAANVHPNGQWQSRLSLASKKYNNANSEFSLIAKFCSGQWGYYAWNKAYRKEIIDKHNITFPPGLKLGEDKVFNLRYLLHCSKVRTSSNVTYGYRTRYGSAFRGASAEDLWRGHCNALLVTEKTLRDHSASAVEQLTVELLTSPTIHQALPDLIKGIQLDAAISNKREKLDELLQLAQRSWFSPRGVNLSWTGKIIFYFYCNGFVWLGKSIWGHRVSKTP